MPPSFELSGGLIFGDALDHCNSSSSAKSDDFLSLDMELPTNVCYHNDADDDSHH